MPLKKNLKETIIITLFFFETDNNNNLTNSSLVTSFYQSNTKANVGGNSTNVTVQGTGSLTHAAIFEFRTTNTSNFTDAYR